MKMLIDGAEIVDVPAKLLNKGDHYLFPCGCRFPIRRDLPPVNNQHWAIEYDIENVSLECQATWDLIGSGRTKGVFQLESGLGRTWSKRLKPRNMEHLAALIALLRPGTLNSRDEETGLSMTETYVKRKNGELEYVPDIEAISSIVDTTYGVLVFQEQQISLAQNVAGFNLVESDTLRKSVAKKQASLLAEVGKLFVDKASDYGVITREKAEALFEIIKKAGRYSFNKCPSFDTLIMRPGGGKPSPYTLEEMYRIRTDIEYAKATGHLSLHKKWKLYGHYGYGLSTGDDGRIRPNVIEDIRPAGVQPVFMLTLENGATIRVTGNHKFPTGDGEKPLCQLKPGDVLYCRGEYEKTKNTYAFSTMTRAEIRERGRGEVNGAGGDRNWFYTNGSYSEFHKNKPLLPLHCYDCGGEHRRLETHHVDGDRCNSKIENLVNLCPSCHKIREYAVGRTRKGEKGYPTVPVRIASILPDGECMTYDVTMKAPHHNFVVSTGIVTCNSHAVAYGYDTFWSAHWKTHFPLYFFTSYLFYAKDKKGKGGPLKEMRQVITDAKSFGIEVEPPHFTQMQSHFGTDGVKVTFGLADVKEVGEKVVEKMKANLPAIEAERGPCVEWSWFDYLRYFAPVAGKTATRKMIEVGALRDLGDYQRVRLLHEFGVYEKLTDTEKGAIVDLAEPLIKEAAVKKVIATPTDEDEFDPVEMKSYKAALRKFEKGKLATAPEPPKPVGKKVKYRKESVRDDDGNLLYEAVLGPEGEPVVLDPARPVHNLEDALQGLLDRPKAVTARRREIVSDLLKTLRNPPSLMEDRPYWVAKKEEENLGIALTCSNVSAADRSIVNCTIKEFHEGKELRRGEQLVLGIEVQEVFEREVKTGPNTGRKMGRLVGADDSGVLEDVVVFADAWEKVGPMLVREGAVVAVGGKRHWDYPKDRSFVVENAWEI